MADETSVDGLTELLSEMNLLPARVERQVVRAGLNAGAQVFQNALEQTVPVDKGDLQDSLARKIHVSSNLTATEALIGPRYIGGYKHTSQDPGVRGIFLEKGTRKMAPRFWVQRAYESAKGAAVDAALAVMRGIMERLPK